MFSEQICRYRYHILHDVCI